MLKIIAILFLLTMLDSCKNKSTKTQTVNIFVKSSGGDKNSSILLQAYFNKKRYKSEIFETSQGIDEKSSEKTIFMGQGVVSEIIDKNIKIPKNSYLYSHIVSDKIINFAQSTNSTIVTTKSEFLINKKKLPEKSILIPLATPTYIKIQNEQLYQANKKEVDAVFKNKHIIHLGGSYKDAENNNVVITNEQFQKALKNLKINKNDSVAIILHPRSTMDLDGNLDQILVRLKAMQISKNTTFFVPNSLHDLLKNKSEFASLKITQSPSYGGILYAINELNFSSKHYISVDQYNAFSDIKYRIHGFLLNPSDKNQSLYLKEYKKTNLDGHILKNFIACFQETSPKMPKKQSKHKVYFAFN